MKLFQWQQEFDGRQPPIEADEQQRVSREFHRYVGSILQEVIKSDYYLEETSQSRKLVPSSGNQADIVRFTIDYEGRKVITPSIFAYQLLSERPRKTISSTYGPNPAGMICRTDTGHNPQLDALRGHSSIFAEVQLPEGFTDEKMFDQLISAAQYRVNEEAANKQLEIDAGLNSQPIGWQELSNLMGSVNAAVPLL